jgi:N-acetylglutamate synthase-like GNAT family acetyltransferase
MSPQVRTATVQDAAGIARLCTELGYAVSGDVMLARLDRMLTSPIHSVLVAHDQDRLLGWITGEARVTLETGDRVEITGLVVASFARRIGVGRLLVADIERWAVGRQCKEVVVRSNISRSESHPFYEKLGYKRAKTQHAYKKVLEDF